MTDEVLTEEQVAEFSNLDADTFDLGEFLDGKWDFPIFHAAVYLDGASAGQISEIDQRVHEVRGVIEKAQRQNKGRSGSLVGNSYVDTSSEEAELEELRTQRDELATRFKNSSLRFTFQLQESSTELNKRANEATRKKFPDVKDIDADDDAAVHRGRVLMTGCIKEVRNHQGQKFGKAVDVGMIEKLYAQLVASERAKLEQNMVLAISGGDVMRRAADAGFPG
jgi:hypothetical protein